MDSDIQVRLGKRIRELRTARGLSQEASAEMIGIHWTYLSQLERGLRNPTLVSLDKIAKAFNITLSELLNYI